MRRLALALAGLAAPAAAQWLHAPQPVPTGDVPHRVAAGDVDGDGDADIVTLNGGFTTTEPPATLSVVAGDGGGVFGSSFTQPAAARANDMKLGDVTGDGDLDAILVATPFQTVSVHASNGLGGFAAPVSTATGGASVCVTVADLDLDGWLDVLAGNGTQDTVSVMSNDGAGALLPAVLVTVDNTAQVLFVDLLNGDALPDLLVLGGSGDSVRLFPGTGGGALGAKQIVYAVTGLCATLGDVNGDGRPDYVSGRPGASFADPDLAETALNDGTGHFTMHVQVLVGHEARDIGVGDFDLDGKADVAVSCEDDDALFVLRGDGAGGLVAGVYIPIEDTPWALTVAELSGDGRSDVAVVSPEQDAVHVLLANRGRLQFGTPTSTASGNSSSSIVLGDLDGDDDLDAVSSVFSKDNVVRMLGTGTGDFTLKKDFTAGDGPRDVRLADMDLDGDLDVAYALGNASAVAVMPGLGNGNFGAPTTFASASTPTLVAAADVDGDLLPDLLATTSVPAQVQLWRGDGAGGVGLPESFPLPATAAAGAGDLDGDGVADLLLTFASTEEVAPFLADGAGGFTLGAGVRTGWSVRLPTIGDVDGDGRADGLAVTGSHGEVGATVSLLRGDGAGALLPPQHVAMSELYTLAARDLNGDGRQDVAGAGLHFVTGSGAVFQTIYVLEAEEGGLGRPSVMINDMQNGGLALADLNGDGRAEVVANSPLMAAPNLSEPHPWHDHGHALAGVHGEPALRAVSWAEPGSPGALFLASAAPSAAAALFVSPFSTPAPFKGGVLFPVPTLLTVPLVTDPQGRIELAWASWPPLGSGENWWLQAAVADAAAPKGVSISGALRLIQP